MQCRRSERPGGDREELKASGIRCVCIIGGVADDDYSGIAELGAGAQSELGAHR